MSRKRKVQSYLRTEQGNAEMFASAYGQVVKFDHKQGRWLIWNKKLGRWLEDKQHNVRMLMAKIARLRLRSAVRLPQGQEERVKQIRWALSSENRNRIDASLELAKSIPPISDDGENWDSNPWLLSVDNGVVDLRTGKLREERPEDRITLRSPIKFDPEAKCPRFERFMLEIFNGDSEFVSFLQRAVGYSLTGLAEEQCAFFCYGNGANGKSTFLGVLHSLLGDYAVNVPFSTLERKDRSGIRNDVAMLAGKRFATAIETGEDVRLNEARIKAITGSDPITGRFLYHENFTFNPTHKLWLAFNHRPRIADDSEGMWRRVKLIPFTRQFRGQQRDKKLFDVLKAEARGILAWAVRGTLLWRKHGLGEPQTVTNATAEYRKESDHFEHFVDECCTGDPNSTVLTAALWDRYQHWASQNGERSLSRTAFTERLKQRGFTGLRVGHKGTRGWRGLRLADAQTANSQEPGAAALDLSDFVEELVEC